MAEDEQPQPDDGAEAKPVVTYPPHAGKRKFYLMLPYSVDGRLVSELTLSPPTMADIRDWCGGLLEGQIALIARMTGETPETLEAMAWPDAEPFLALVRSMLPAFVVSELERTE